eukprot:gnl/Hemi2/22486_TR7493_c0_g1_i1.p1 gnl/Hemi2/22486_TR7493_c0_g1~~gnl/Hemi2/22486_TR7493_c0_g1_i1.p1  ORF type:complete len:1112 (-),score=214.81 gnl/Hemi2/22486_TR7493_c0_g1_i1:123-3458(-)
MGVHRPAAGHAGSLTQRPVLLLLWLAVACSLLSLACCARPQVGDLFDGRYILRELLHVTYEKDLAVAPASDLEEDESSNLQLLQLQPWPLTSATHAHYTSPHELSSGSFGNVWRVTDTVAGKDIALKLFLKNDGTRFLKYADCDAAMLSKLKGECKWPKRIAARVPGDERSSYFPICYNAFIDGMTSSYMYLELSLVPGQALSLFTMTADTTRDNVQSMLYQLVSALDYMTTHTGTAVKPFIHHDLKGRNAIAEATGGGNVKVTVVDLGELMECTAEKAIKGAVGTKLFTAPEVRNHTYRGFCPPGTCHCSSFDMYSVGVMFGDFFSSQKEYKFAYLLDDCRAAGYHPADLSLADFENFLKNNLFKTNNIRTDRYDWFRHVKDAGGWDLLRRMIDPTPSSRITPAEALRHIYLAALDVPRLERIAAVKREEERRLAAELAVRKVQGRDLRAFETACLVSTTGTDVNAIPYVDIAVKWDCEDIRGFATTQSDVYVDISCVHPASRNADDRYQVNGFLIGRGQPRPRRLSGCSSPTVTAIYEVCDVEASCARNLFPVYPISSVPPSKDTEDLSVALARPVLNYMANYRVDSGDSSTCWLSTVTRTVALDKRQYTSFQLQHPDVGTGAIASDSEVLLIKRHDTTCGSLRSKYLRFEIDDKPDCPIWRATELNPIAPPAVIAEADRVKKDLLTSAQTLGVAADLAKTALKAEVTRIEREIDTMTAEKLEAKLPLDVQNLRRVHADELARLQREYELDLTRLFDAELDKLTLGDPYGIAFRYDAAAYFRILPGPPTVSVCFQCLELVAAYRAAGHAKKFCDKYNLNQRAKTACSRIKASLKTLSGSKWSMKKHTSSELLRLYPDKTEFELCQLAHADKRSPGWCEPVESAAEWYATLVRAVTAERRNNRAWVDKNGPIAARKAAYAATVAAANIKLAADEASLASALARELERINSEEGRARLAALQAERETAAARPATLDPLITALSACAAQVGADFFGGPGSPSLGPFFRDCAIANTAVTGCGLPGEGWAGFSGLFAEACTSFASAREVAIRAGSLHSQAPLVITSATEVSLGAVSILYASESKQHVYAAEQRLDQPSLAVGAQGEKYQWLFVV